MLCGERGGKGGPKGSEIMFRKLVHFLFQIYVPKKVIAFSLSPLLSLTRSHSLPLPILEQHRHLPLLS